MIRTMTLVLVLAAACGGQKAAPATTTTAASETGSAAGAPMHHDMPGMPPELSKFHDVLAPRWHADKGPKRMKDTCDAMPAFHTEADSLAKGTPPQGANADSWTTGTKQLVASVDGLDTTCKANDAAQFETAFQKVHESFHGLLAAAGMKMEGMDHEHMEHMEHMEHHEGMEHGEHKM